MFVGNHSVWNVLDAGEYMRTPIGRLLKASGIADRYLRDGEELPPGVRGIGLTPIPRPEKMYFLVGKPIDMRPYRDHAEDPETLRRVRNRVARQVNRQIGLTRQYRARNDRGGAVRRLNHL